MSDYVVDELRRVFACKFPHRLAALDSFLAGIFSCVSIVSTPYTGLDVEDAIREPKERPVLRAARACGADFLLTGDKDFFEDGIS